MTGKIYTKTGDKGETSLLGGKRVSKSCLEMQVIGEVDELNAALGVVVALLNKKNDQDNKVCEIVNFIQVVQRDLFKFGAELAALHMTTSSNAKEEEKKISARGGPALGGEKIDAARVVEMEQYIDMFWGKLPELRNFILPGGSITGAEIHRARTVCRRVERQLVEFGKSVSLRPELTIYINRLSDFLFAAARFINAREGVEEIIV